MTYTTADGHELTDETLEAEARMLERGERPARWERGATVFRVAIPSEYTEELRRRAASRNESEGEYISNLVGAILATA